MKRFLPVAALRMTKTYYRHSDKDFDFLTWQEVMSERNIIINSIAPNMSTLYRHLHGGYCNRDFPIAPEKPAVL